jgi:hypothetical protein
MTPTRRSWTLGLLAGLLVFGACAGSEVPPTTGGGGGGDSGTGGTTGVAGMTGVAGTTGVAGNNGVAGTSGVAGAAGTGVAGAAGTGVAGAGPAGRGGAAGGVAGRGGAAGGVAGRGGAAGGVAGATGGSSAPTGTGGAVTTPTPLDCGPMGWAVENHGPPANRVNYVILGDGYTSADLGAGGRFEQHINTAFARRFHAQIGQPYARYRNFVNVCAIKVVSNGAICGSSALGCCGDDGTRLANCSSSQYNPVFSALPASLSIDWRAIMLNGNSWWNTGAQVMLWSGAHTDAPGAALHEGGHGFHQLADEYGTCTGANCGSNTMGQATAGTGSASMEVNSCGNPATTDGKWDMWIGYNQAGATGLQGTWNGSRYVANQYRPSANSMMNSLFCQPANCNTNTSFNAPSREQMVMSIWRVVRPIDSTEPAAGAVSNPAMLKVNVIDPAVINVDWSVDGKLVAENGGPTFDVAGAKLSAGTHEITARAYDNATEDLVRNRSSKCPSSVTGRYCHGTSWSRSEEKATWMVTIP